MEERIVTIKQSTAIFTTIPVGLRDEIVKKVGSRINPKTKDVLIGLNKEEREYILPKVVEITEDNTGLSHATRVRNWYADLTIKVPYREGKTLDITTSPEDVGKKDKEGNVVLFDMPLNPLDYIMYKQCLVDDSVATTDFQKQNPSMYLFVLVDEGIEKNKKIATQENLDILDTMYLMLISKHKAGEHEGEFKDEAKMDSVIRLLGYNPQVLEPSGKVFQLKEAKEEAKTLVENGNDINTTGFFKVVNDKELGVKSLIMTLVERGVLIMSGTHFADSQDTKLVVGGDIDQAVAYFNNTLNSEQINKWRFTMKGQATSVI